LVHRLASKTHYAWNAGPREVNVQKANAAAGASEAKRKLTGDSALANPSLAREHENLVLDVLQATIALRHAGERTEE
jgi:hypothetical protein